MVEGQTLTLRFRQGMQDAEGRDLVVVSDCVLISLSLSLPVYVCVVVMAAEQNPLQSAL